MRVSISVVVPTFNEACQLRAALLALQPLRHRGHEVIVVDGQSTDGTAGIARPLCDRMLECETGRALQMNAGARVARGDVLLFLHADTTLPGSCEQAIRDALQTPSRGWGRFDISLSGPSIAYRIISFFMNWRSRLTGIATGDQAIFVRRDWFERVGGFPDIPLMEDVRLSAMLKKRAPPACLPQRVVSSSRRWERQGVVKTVLLMWCLRVAHAFGADPANLHRLYYRL